MSDQTERAAEVLRHHQLGEPDGGTASEARCRCSCGHVARVPGGMRETAHVRARRHVAQALDAAGLLAAPVDGELREALARAAGDVVWRIHGPESTDRESAEEDGGDLADALLPIIAAHVAEERQMAVAEFVGQQSVRYRRHSGAALQEDIELAIEHFGVPRGLIYGEEGS